MGNKVSEVASDVGGAVTAVYTAPYAAAAHLAGGIAHGLGDHETGRRMHDTGNDITSSSVKVGRTVASNTVLLGAHWIGAVDEVDVDKGAHPNHDEFYVVGCAIRSFTPAMHVGIVWRRESSWLSIQKLQSGHNELVVHGSYGDAADRVREVGVGKGARALMRCGSRSAGTTRPAISDLQRFCDEYNSGYNLATNNCQHFVDAFRSSFER